MIHHTSIASFIGMGEGLQPLPDKFGELERQLESFAQQKPISIRSAQKLAALMAGQSGDHQGRGLDRRPMTWGSASVWAASSTTFKENLLPSWSWKPSSW